MKKTNRILSTEREQIAVATSLHIQKEGLKRINSNQYVSYKKALRNVMEVNTGIALTPYHGKRLIKIVEPKRKRHIFEDLLKKTKMYIAS